MTRSYETYKLSHVEKSENPDLYLFMSMIDRKIKNIKKKKIIPTKLKVLQHILLTTVSLKLEHQWSVVVDKYILKKNLSIGDKNAHLHTT